MTTVIVQASGEAGVLIGAGDFSFRGAGAAVTVQEFSFFGLGAETPRRESAGGSESMSDESVARFLADCPAGAVTHTPALCYADLQSDGSRAASPSVL